MSTIDQPELAPDARPSRSFARAVDDIRQGLTQRELWSHLAWQDIKQRYRRSVIGPLWITISMAVTSIGLGVVYGLLFGNPIEYQLPYVTTGFIVWSFISGSLTEGMDTFISNEGLIKHLPAPLSVYALRTVWRQTLMFFHNVLIYVVVLAIFFRYLDKPYTMNGSVCGPHNAAMCHPGLSWSWFLAVPGLLVLALNALWLALLFGIISTRYRDIPQVINSLINLLFYMTPIVWSPDSLLTSDRHGWAKIIFDLNPLYHFVQIVRAPLTGQQLSPASWYVVGGITIAGWALALVVMRNYRARVSYWV
ncbi:MAG TPA: ABC transporter permease [Pseudonocardiaceae bacterium]|jgi:ABC-2 type transport system permease protein|nr:ABC transporter permease [Pseudonocardiaceae bacterium]